MPDPTPLVDQLPDVLPRAVLEEMLVNRAAVDGAFRRQLRDDPRAALTDFFGAAPPSDLDLQTFEEDASTFYYVVSNPNYFTPRVSVGPNRVATRAGFRGQVGALLASDPDFPAAFAEDPTAAVEQGLNLTFPEGVELHVLQETGHTIYLVLPYAPHQGLLMGPYSLQFDGASARATVPDAPELHVQDAVTVEAWLRTPGAVPDGTLASWSDGAAGWELAVAAGAPAFTVYTAAGALTARPESPAFWLRPNDWAYLTGIYTGEGILLYVDGRLAASGEGGGAVAGFGGGLALGARPGEDPAGPFFNGQLHEVRLWGDVLPESYVQDNRIRRGAVEDTPEAQQERLLAHYPMEEGAGTRLVDASGFGHDGTLDGAVWVATGIDSPP